MPDRILITAFTQTPWSPTAIRCLDGEKGPIPGTYVRLAGHTL